MFDNFFLCLILVSTVMLGVEYDGAALHCSVVLQRPLGV
jgi:hypothetical protein